MQKISLNRLWKESGKSVPFHQFCEQFNQANFKNFTGGAGTSAGPEPTLPINIKAPQTDLPLGPSDMENMPVKTESAPAIPLVPSPGLNTKEGVLLVLLGVSIGVVAVIAYNKLS